MHSKGVLFDCLDQSAVISRKIPKNGFQQFSSSVSSHIKHFAEFSVDNILQTRAKIVEKSPNVFVHVPFVVNVVQ